MRRKRMVTGGRQAAGSPSKPFSKTKRPAREAGLDLLIDTDENCLPRQVGISPSAPVNTACPLFHEVLAKKKGSAKNRLSWWVNWVR